MAGAQTVNSTKIWWIERLLQTPIDDHRKFVVWRILALPFNIRKCPADEPCNIMRDWFDRCSTRRRLDFNPNYTKKI